MLSRLGPRSGRPGNAVDKEAGEAPHAGARLVAGSKLGVTCDRTFVNRLEAVPSGRRGNVA